MPTPTPQDPPTPTEPHSPFRVVPAQTNHNGPYDMWAVEHNGITLVRWNQLGQADQDAKDRYRRWLAEGQPDPTPPLPSVTELLNSLDKARQAFENATPTGHLHHQIEGYAARLDLAEQDLARERRNKAGLSQGETDRLRRIEAALVELGAPNHGTRQDPSGPMITWIRAQVAALDLVKAERDELRTMLTDAEAELAALKPNTEVAVLPDNWRDQIADPDHACDAVFLIDLIESWRGTKPAATEELPPNDTVYQATSYVANLVRAATGSWPGWAYPAEVVAAVDEALREIERLRAEATRPAADAVHHAALRLVEEWRGQLVALLRDHPGGGLIHEPANWVDTLGIVRAHLVHRKLDRDLRTKLIQAVSRWVTAGEPVADWQLIHLVTQLANRAADRRDATEPDPSRPVTFIDEQGRAHEYTFDQVLDAMKHSDKGPTT